MAAEALGSESYDCNNRTYMLNVDRLALKVLAGLAAKNQHVDVARRSSPYSPPSAH
jgi:hypothetical protein